MFLQWYSFSRKDNKSIPTCYIGAKVLAGLTFKMALEGSVTLTVEELFEKNDKEWKLPEHFTPIRMWGLRCSCWWVEFHPSLPVPWAVQLYWGHPIQWCSPRVLRCQRESAGPEAESHGTSVWEGPDVCSLPPGCDEEELPLPGCPCSSAAVPLTTAGWPHNRRWIWWGLLLWLLRILWRWDPGRSGLMTRSTNGCLTSRFYYKALLQATFFQDICQQCVRVG